MGVVTGLAEDVDAFLVVSLVDVVADYAEELRGKQRQRHGRGAGQDDSGHLEAKRACFERLWGP